MFAIFRPVKLSSRGERSWQTFAKNTYDYPVSTRANILVCVVQRGIRSNEQTLSSRVLTSRIYTSRRNRARNRARSVQRRMLDVPICSQGPRNYPALIEATTLEASRAILDGPEVNRPYSTIARSPFSRSFADLR